MIPPVDPDRYELVRALLKAAHEAGFPMMMIAQNSRVPVQTLSNIKGGRAGMSTARADVIQKEVTRLLGASVVARVREESHADLRASLRRMLSEQYQGRMPDLARALAVRTAAIKKALEGGPIEADLESKSRGLVGLVPANGSTDAPELAPVAPTPSGNFEARARALADKIGLEALAYVLDKSGAVNR